jgi:benzodiazapine receptor
MAILLEPHSTSFFRKGLLLKILFSSLSIILLGGLSAYNMQVSGWFENDVVKPFFQPPNWLFGPVWTLLYITMGISFGRIWQVANRSRYPIIRKYALRGMFLFIMHLILNLAWTPVFFGLQNPLLALVVILVLWLMILFVIRHFNRLDSLSGLILIPYLLWVTFASILNFSIVMLNN